MWFLDQKGIQCGVHYPIPIHLQKAYRDLGYPAGSFPVAEGMAREFISLPMYPELRPAQVDSVVFALREALLNGAMKYEAPASAQLSV
jgi:dTDP-4-amino-4,6-dideoxygalactose transaminase